MTLLPIDTKTTNSCSTGPDESERPDELKIINGLEASPIVAEPDSSESDDEIPADPHKRPSFSFTPTEKLKPLACNLKAGSDGVNDGSSTPNSSSSSTPNSASTGALNTRDSELVETLFREKERHRESISKVFLGDYISLGCEPLVRKILEKHGEKKILFADVVSKINKRNKMQQRVLMITEKAIYNIDYTKKYKVKRRIEIKDVDEVKMSKLADDFFAICVPSEYDYLLVSAKKTEIALKIYEAKEALTNETLKLSFSNWYEIDMY